MQPPNKAIKLQFKWFYMAFCSVDCAKYVERGQCLCNKILESVVEYFKNIFSLQVADSSLAKKLERQIEHCTKRKLCHMLKKRYKKKICCITEQRHRGDGHHSRHGMTFYYQDYKWKGCNHSNHHHNYDKRKKKQEDETPFDCGNKPFKPCPTQGLKSNQC
jgi:hypothetical protein